MSAKPRTPYGYCKCCHSYWSHIVTILPGLGLRNVCERIGCRCLEFERDPDYPS